MYSWVEIPLHGINGERVGYFKNSVIKQKEILFKSLAIKYFNVKQSNISENILLESFYTATIEGARTTLEMVKAGRNKKDERMVLNCNKALNAIINLDLTLDNIIAIWKMIVDGVCENQNVQGAVFRKDMVYIGNEDCVVHTPVDASKIDYYMSDLINYYESESDIITKSIVMQFYLEYIHPMCDGNGRLGRLLTLWSLNKSAYSFMVGMPVSKMINQNIKQYYNSFVESESICFVGGNKCLDLTSFIDFMLQMFIDAIKEVDIKSSMTLTELQKLILTKMSEHGVGTEFSSRKCAIVIGIPEDLAYEQFIRLANAGYVECVGNKVFKLKVSI